MEDVQVILIVWIWLLRLDSRFLIDLLIFSIVAYISLEYSFIMNLTDYFILLSACWSLPWLLVELRFFFYIKSINSWWIFSFDSSSFVFVPIYSILFDMTVPFSIVVYNLCSMWERTGKILSLKKDKVYEFTDLRFYSFAFCSSVTS